MMKTAFALILLLSINLASGCQGKKPLVYSTIHEAAEKGDLQDVKRHVQNGTALNAKGPAGMTALHVAVISGHKDIVEYLIKQGADVNAVVPFVGPTLEILRTQSFTPMTSQAYDEMVDLLKKHGAK